MRMSMLSLLIAAGFASEGLAASTDDLAGCAAKPVDAEALACFRTLAAEPDVAPIDPTDTPPPSPAYAWLIKGDLSPSLYGDDISVHKDPAKLSLSRSDNDNAFDARAALVYQRYFGEFRTQVFYSGIAWSRVENGDKPSDARSISVGLNLLQQDDEGDNFYATLNPSITHTTDIFKNEKTDRYRLASEFGVYALRRFVHGRRSSFWFEAALDSTHVRPEGGSKQDSLTASLGAHFVQKLTPRLYFEANPAFYNFIDAPGGAEKRDWYGNVLLRWQLHDKDAKDFRPALTLSRTFGTHPNDATWIANQTVLALTISFDSHYRPRDE